LYLKKADFAAAAAVESSPFTTVVERSLEPRRNFFSARVVIALSLNQKLDLLGRNCEGAVGSVAELVCAARGP
jgi:hypothetical protein